MAKGALHFCWVFVQRLVAARRFTLIFTVVKIYGVV